MHEQRGKVRTLRYGNCNAYIYNDPDMDAFCGRFFDFYQNHNTFIYANAYNYYGSISDSYGNNDGDKNSHAYDNHTMLLDRHHHHDADSHGNA